MTRAYMINTTSRPHAKIYGDGVFFDLDCEGPQARMLVDISSGTECYVASYADKQRSTVVIAKYSFEREERLKNETPGEICRVFFGRKLEESRLLKKGAASTPEFAPFFNKRGHFLQRSAFLWPYKRSGDAP